MSINTNTKQFVWHASPRPIPHTPLSALTKMHLLSAIVVASWAMMGGCVVGWLGGVAALHGICKATRAAMGWRSDGPLTANGNS